MSEHGHQVAGDKKYGSRRDNNPTLALHAGSLCVTHPVNGKRLTFTAAVPDSFSRLVGTIEGLVLFQV
jgi:23S rRNA-/tRNA-specific pseudouridylate synthase